MKEEERSRYIRPSVVKIDDVNSSDAFTKSGFLNKSILEYLGH